MIKIAVCDDNQAVCSQIQKVCKDFSSQNYISIQVVTYNSGKSLVKAMKSTEYFDLIFLDIELGNESGINVGLEIRDNLKQYTSEIVYISSFTKYALKLFQIQPMDFLIKPLNVDKIQCILSKFIKQYDISGKKFKYKIGHEEKKIPLADIIYFESVLKEVRICSITDEFIQFYGSLKSIREELIRLNVKFISPHKSFIINYKWIKEFHPTYLVMCNNVKISIARNNKKDVEAFFLTESENEEIDGRF